MAYNYIRFISWNLDFWKRTCNDRSSSFYKSQEMVNLWKEQAKYNLSQLQADFVLLQEINPFSIHNEKYEQTATHNYDLKIDRNSIYYYELAKQLEQEKVEKKNFWGLSIIADEKFNLLEKYSSNEQDTFMCCDFQLAVDKVVTIINFYNKAKNGKYSFNANFIASLENIVKNKNGNMIILAGDFNSDINDYQNKEAFMSIIDMGFINKTEKIGTTMINYDYQNDHLFVNKTMDQHIRDIRKFKQWNITDHYGLSCTIKL